MVHRLALNPLSHSSQGTIFKIYLLIPEREGERERERGREREIEIDVRETIGSLPYAP